MVGTMAIFRQLNIGPFSNTASIRAIMKNVIGAMYCCFGLAARTAVEEHVIALRTRSGFSPATPTGSML
jgi:hypothetical protein